MAGCLVSLVLGLQWAIAEALPIHAGGVSALSVLSRRTARATAARACRGRCSTLTEPILKLRSPPNSPCCAKARCAESTVPEDRRRKPGALATLVAHSPYHRSSRFTGRCSSPSGLSCTRQSPLSCPLARRCQVRWRAPCPRAAITSQARFRSPRVAHSPRHRSSRFTGRCSSPSSQAA